MKYRLSNNSKMSKKFMQRFTAFLAISSIIASAHIIEHAVRYGTFLDDYNSPDNVYEQDNLVPPGYFNDYPVVVAVSNDFSDVEFAEIEKGIDLLDNCAEGIKFEIVKTNKKTRRYDDQILILKDTDGKYVYGMTYGVAIESYTTKYCPENYAGTIYLHKDLSVKVIERTTIHEILHLFGFKHERDHKSIMSHKCGCINTNPTKRDIYNINKKFPKKYQYNVENINNRIPYRRQDRADLEMN